MAIVRLALAVTRQLVEESCLAVLSEGAGALLGGRWTLAYLVSEDGNDLRRVAGSGPRGLQALARRLDLLDEGLIRVLAPAGPAILDGASALLEAGTKTDGEVPDLGAALLTPLHSGAGRAGLLLSLTARGEGFDTSALRRAAALADELIPALDNLRTVASLRELVIRDDTADCFNRRFLDQTLEDETERCRRFGSRFALIFLDMDNLKEINTRHGHAAGSRVLYEASVRISRSIRSIDRLFRYGGDEFVVLLPGTVLEGAAEVAERIRRELSTTPFEVAPGALVQLTASLGVAAWPDHGSGAREVVEAADQVMREIKAHGKDAVAVAERRVGVEDDGVG